MAQVAEQASAGNSYDMIVIGSGIGALSYAALAARLSGERVLLLEQHDKPGGLTHEFHREEGYQWDVGLHYVGHMGYGQMGRRLMNYITEEAIDWRPLPDPFETFIYPDTSFSVPFERSAYQRKLIATYPHQEKAIEQYFQDLEKAASWMSFHMARKSFPGWMHFLSGLFEGYGKSLALQTTAEYMQERFSDPELRRLLCSLWLDYGLPPGESAFGVHAIVVDSYLDGAYYPSGGPEQIAQHALPAIERAGGTCLTRRSVQEILVEGQRAVGVRAHFRQDNDAHSEEYYYAPIIVSDAGAFTTYLSLLPETVDLPFREQIRTFPHGISAAILYLGLQDTPARLGVRGENYWLYTGYDHDAMRAQAGEALQGRPPYAFVTFPSMKDPTALKHTAQAIVPIDYESFRRATGERGLENAEVYHQMKAEMSEGILALIEQHLPGFRELIAVQELATPFTLAHFTSRPFGSMYGVPAVPERYKQPWTDIETPVQGLYLTGSDVASNGILGAAMGGVLTYGKVMGTRAFGRAMELIKQED
jgi:phytoene dehydrogenase-like protein